MLLLNVVLAFAWGAIIGEITPSTLIVGFAIGYFILWLEPSRGQPNSYFAKVRRVILFAVFFLKELVIANLRIFYDVVTPRHHMQPGIVAIPLDVKTDAEITLLANLITLTPGTLSLDVSSDRKVLYIHAMYMGSPEKLRREIKEGFERRVMEVTR